MSIYNVAILLSICLTVMVVLYKKFVVIIVIVMHNNIVQCHSRKVSRFSNCYLTQGQHNFKTSHYNNWATLEEF